MLMESPELGWAWAFQHLPDQCLLIPFPLAGGGRTAASVLILFVRLLVLPWKVPQIGQGAACTSTASFPPLCSLILLSLAGAVPADVLSANSRLPSDKPSVFGSAGSEMPLGLWPYHHPGLSCAEQVLLQP